jgi:uncharacterized membrane protein
VNPLIPIHIAGGTAALLAGALALFLFRKGARPHAWAGTIFFLSILVLAGTGAVIAALKPERGTAVIGILTCYLVATSWATARRRDGRAGGFELAGLLVASGCAAAFLAFAVQGANSPTGRVDSLPAAVHVPFAALALLAAALDLNFILRRELGGGQRIARHLWRMCAALLIAAFSFFLGQQKVMPEYMQGSPLLFVPPLAVLAAMVFWLLRVRFSRAFRRFTPRPRGRLAAGRDPAEAIA